MVLWVLMDAGPRSLRQLSDELGLEQSTVNRQVNAAMTRGLLERVKIESQAARLIQPTSAGVEAYLEDREMRTEFLTTVLAELEPGEAGLLRELQALNDAYDRVLGKPE